MTMTPFVPPHGRRVGLVLVPFKRPGASPDSPYAGLAVDH